MAETRRQFPKDDQTADWWERFDIAVAKWLLGLVDEEELKRAAAAALSARCESPALWAIGGLLQNVDQSTLLPLVFASYEERGIEFPLRNDAIDRCVLALLAAMTTGAVSPEEASVTLWSPRRQPVRAE
jgi:hypothetical protein